MTPGTSIGGKYRLLRLLGNGSMGEVWAALHVNLGREVAVKLIHDDNPDLAERLKREGMACARLEHPNIVRVYDIGEAEGGNPFLVMEVLTGETLADRIAARRLEPVEVIAIGLGIAHALHAAHGAGIVHRDLKPANVYLHRGAGTDVEVVKVLDFGVSKMLASHDRGVTVTGALVGSPAYMSPEQARTPREIDPRADLWSVGILLFEMIAGQRPFTSRTVLGVLADILDAPIPRLASLVPAVDPGLEAVVYACLQRNVAQRIPSAEALIDALEPLYAAALRPPPKPPRPARAIAAPPTPPPRPSRPVSALPGPRPTPPLPPQRAPRPISPLPGPPPPDGTPLPRAPRPRAPSPSLLDEEHETFAFNPKAPRAGSEPDLAQTKVYRQGTPGEQAEPSDAADLARASLSEVETRVVRLGIGEPSAPSSGPLPWAPQPAMDGDTTLKLAEGESEAGLASWPAERPFWQRSSTLVPAAALAVLTVLLVVVVARCASP